MLISVNNIPKKQEFELLLDETLISLRNAATTQSKKYLDLLGNKLENEVFDMLNVNAKGTPFEGSIELISGQKFPDIIAKKYYGIEVKTTKSNHWKSTGSSVAEGTRVEGIERIFMLFGKMAAPVEFMCRPYEDCLSEVVVTHSPRYLIDMNLKKGQTIFDKLEIPYDELRKKEKPINTILDYYRKKLKQGDDVWYLGQETSSNFIIKMWSNLSAKDKETYRIKGFCLFPELVSKRQDKFNRYAVWLTSREGVINTSIRDTFTAGGKEHIDYQGVRYEVPKIIKNIYANIEGIKTMLSSIETEELEMYWSCKIPPKNDLFELWLTQIEENAATILSKKFPLREILLSV